MGNGLKRTTASTRRTAAPVDNFNVRDGPRATMVALGGKRAFAAALTNVRNESAAGYEVSWPSGTKAAQSF